MPERSLILLSYYALSNGTHTLVLGQLTLSSLLDFSFTAFSRRKTFRTLLSLYRTTLFANEEITLEFNNASCTANTDSSGAFFFETDQLKTDSQLLAIRVSSGKAVELKKELYSFGVHTVASTTILVSDIDDTLLHSHVSRGLLKFRTLMFTALEKRLAVTEMRKVVQNFHVSGITPFYLSNSEQNLYPLIYRFLKNNSFPDGPLFLRQMRLLRHVLRKRNINQKDLHKLSTLERLFLFLPDKQFILVGDNTQNDLAIYLEIAEKFPSRVLRIIIRQVTKENKDKRFVDAVKKIKALAIPFHYGESFPSEFVSGD